MDRWLCCDMTVGGRSEVLWIPLDRQLEGAAISVVVRAPDVEPEVAVTIGLDRCVPADGPPPSGALVGRLADAARLVGR